MRLCSNAAVGFGRFAVARLKFPWTEPDTSGRMVIAAREIPSRNEAMMHGREDAMQQGSERNEEARPRYAVVRSYTAGEHAEPSAIGFYHSLRAAAERAAEEALDAAGDIDLDDLTGVVRDVIRGERLPEDHVTGAEWSGRDHAEALDLIADHVERARTVEQPYTGTWHDPEGRSIASWDVVDLDAPEGEAGAGMVDAADVVAQIAADLPFPTHCASCGKLLVPSVERGEGDTIDPAFPYCRACYHGGAGYAHLHAATIGTLRAYGLRASWWNTGGGCWILAIVRDAAPDTWAEQGNGVFLPFVAAGEAFEQLGEWSWESGGVDDPACAWGATYYGTEEAWCGELMAEAEQVAPVDAHGLARFALAHLPAVSPIVPQVSEDLSKVADAIDLLLYTHRDLDPSTVATLREAEATARTASSDAYVAANPNVHPDAL